MANGEVIIDINGDISGFQSEMNKVDGIVKSATSSFNSFSESITKSFLIVGSAITTAGTGFATSVMNVGMDFEAQMSTVQALSNATADDLGLLTDKAKELGASTSFTGTQVGEAFEYMALAGWDTSDMLDGIKGALNTAGASGEDLAVVTDILTDGLTAFSMSASESAQFADVLATTSASSNTTISMLGEAFKYVAPLANTLGYNVEDVSVALGLMADNGIKGSQAGTTLRSALTSMINPSNNAYTAMEELGLATDGTITALMNSDGSTKSLNETLVILRNTFSDLTQEEQANYASTIFGTEAMSGMLAVINSSDDAFNNLTANINDATGSAEEMANVKLDNLQGDITKLGSAVEGLKLQLFDLAMENDNARSAVEQFSTAVGNISNAITTGGVIGAIDQLGTEVARISVDIVAEAPNIVSGVITLMTSFTSTLTAYTPEIKTAFISTLGALTEGYNQFTPSFKILVSNIAPLVVEALVTLVPLMWEMGVEVLTSMAEGIASNIDSISDAGIKAIDSLLNSILDNMPTIVDSGVTIILGIVDGIVDYLPELVEVSIKIIGALAEGLIDNMPEIVACALTVMTSLASAFVENIPLIVETGLNIGKELFSAFTSGVVEIAQELGSELGFIETVIAGVVAGFGAFATAVTIFDKVQTAVSTLSTAFTTVKSTISTVSSVVQIAFGIFTANPFNAVAIAIGVLVTAVILLIANFDDIKTACTNVWNAISEFVSNMVSKFTEGFENVKQKISEFGSNIVEGFNSAKDNCLTVISNLVDSISNTFENFNWKSVGSNIISGITSGVSSMLSSAVSSVKKVASSMYDTVTSFFDIHSPSRLMRDDVGENIVLGMIEGVDNKSEDAIDTMDKLASTMCEPLTTQIEISNTAIEKELSNTLSILEKKSDAIYKANTEEINNTYELITEKLDLLDLSYTEELAIYESMTDMLVKGSAERLDLEERYQEALYNSRVETLEAIQTVTTLSYVEELLAYQDLQEGLAETSELRVETETLVNDKIKEILELSAIEQINIWKTIANNQDINSDTRILAEEKYLSAKQDITEQVIELENEYSNAFIGRYDEIMSMTSLFSAVSQREVVESQSLVDVLNDQVTQLAEWGYMLQNLADRGVTGALFEEIQGLGVGAMDEIKALISMTDEELSNYAQLYEDKQKLANTLATAELSEFRESINLEIAEIIKGAEYEFTDLTVIAQTEVSKMNDAVSSELLNLESNFSSAGDNLIGSIKSAVEDSEYELYQLVMSSKDIMQELDGTTEEASLEIIRNFEDLGKNLIESISKNIGLAGDEFYGLVDDSAKAIDDMNYSIGRQLPETQEHFEELKKGITETMQDTILTASEEFYKIVDSSKNSMSDMNTSIDSQIPNIVQSFTSMSEQLVSAVYDSVSNAGNQFGVISDLVSLEMDSVNTAVSEGQNAILYAQDVFQNESIQLKINEISSKRELTELSYAEELLAYQSLQESIQNSAEQKLYTEEAIQNSITAISQLSANEQMHIWKEVAEAQVTDSDLRILAEEKYLEAKEQIVTQVLALEESYNDAYEKRSESIMNMTSLFSEVSEKEIIQSETLMQNLQNQVDQLANWGQMLQDLADRGIADALFNEIQELGVGAMDEIEALLKMSDEELSKYSQLYEDKQVLANSLAIKQLEQLRADTDNQIAELIKGVEYEFNDLPNITSIAISDMNDTASTELQGLTTAFTYANSQISNSVQDTVDDIGQDFNNLTYTTQNSLNDLTFVVMDATYSIYELFNNMGNMIVSSVYSTISQITNMFNSLSSISVNVPVTATYSSNSSNSASTWGLSDSSNSASTWGLSDSSNSASTWGLSDSGISTMAMSTFSDIGTISSLESGVSTSGASTNSYSTINNSDTQNSTNDTSITINLEYTGSTDTQLDFEDIANYLANEINSQMRGRGLV